jgi:hypothetical protein
MFASGSNDVQGGEFKWTGAVRHDRGDAAAWEICLYKSGMGYPLDRSNAGQRRARVSRADGLFRSVTSVNVGRRGGALRLNG